MKGEKVKGEEISGNCARRIPKTDKTKHRFAAQRNSEHCRERGTLSEDGVEIFRARTSTSFLRGYSLDGREKRKGVREGESSLKMYGGELF